MPRFANQKELHQWRQGRREAASQTRDELARQMGIDACYVEGLHFIRDRLVRQVNAAAGTVRPLPENYNIDGNIRVVANETTKFIIKVASGTQPRRIEIDAMPPAGESSVEASFRAGKHEVMLQAVLDRTGYLAAARTANTRRTIAGQWGVGIGVRTVAGGDRVLYAYEFDPSDLVLDPYERSRNLEDHQEVILETVWTVQKIRQEFPDLARRIDEDKLQTVRELEPQKMRLNNLSEDRIYSRYRMHSDAKAARVSQIHCRDESGRFSYMFITIDLPGGEECPNFDNPESPFGGSGLPMQLLYGHERFDTIWAISDTAMLRADQDKRNLAETIYYRVMKRYGGPRIAVDTRAYPGKTPEEIEEEFTNGSTQIVRYTSGDRNRAVEKPAIMQTPEPPQTLLMLSDRIKEEMREKTFRPQGSYGEVKTHVTSSAFHRALDESAEVMDARVRDDVNAHERLIRVLQGTSIRLIQEGSAWMARCLLGAGMSQDDVAPLMQEDPADPSIHAVVRESTIRYRSHREKRQDLDLALQNQAITPDDYRRAMAGTLEAALSMEDQRMEEESTRAARDVLMGMEWEPLPLSPRNAQTFLGKFEWALFDPIAKQDPEARARLIRAIEGQGTAMLALQQAMTTAASPAEPGEPPEPDEGQQIGPEASPADVLDMLAG